MTQGGETVEKRFYFIVVEGRPDSKVIDRLLRKKKFIRREFRELIDPVWDVLIPKDFPAKKGEKLTSPVPVPSFYEKNHQSVAVQNFGDWTACLKKLKASIDSMEGRIRAPSATCLVLDADDKTAAECFDKLQQETDYDFGASAGEFGAGPMRCGAYFLPNNVDPGTLEQLLLEQAHRAYPRLKAGAENFLLHIFNEPDTYLPRAKDRESINKPVGKEKMLLSTMSAVLKPEKGLSISIQDNDWFRFADGEVRGTHTKKLNEFLTRFLNL